MKIIVDISLDYDKFIEDKIRAGEYRDRAQFIEVAIANLISIEKDGVETIAVNTGKGANNPIKPEDAPKELSKSNMNPPAISRQPEQSSTLVLPSANELYWEGYRENGRTPWLWGLVNSVLAIKYCCRALAWLQDRAGATRLPFSANSPGQKEGKSMPWRSEYFSEIAEQAVDLKAYLQYQDQLHATSRDSKYARSFPTDKLTSLDRFIYHYICSVRQQDASVYAALPWLGFCVVYNADKYEDLELSLTDTGREFACLPNEVLDMRLSDRAPSICTKEERDYYLKTVREFCVPESNAITTIARLISSGHDSPTRLHSALQDERPDWNNNEVISYKGGTLARMMDLGLVNKESAGREACYVLTAIAKGLFE